MEVIINASSLDDIDPLAIGQRLTNGTAAVASPVLSRLKTRDEEHADVVRRKKTFKTVFFISAAIFSSSASLKQNKLEVTIIQPSHCVVCFVCLFVF